MEHGVAGSLKALQLLAAGWEIIESDGTRITIQAGPNYELEQGEPSELTVDVYQGRPNDCLLKIKPDEPAFTLLARDELAPGLVHLWAALRTGGMPAAQTIFTALRSQAQQRLHAKNPDTGFPRTIDVERAEEAAQCGFAMMTWARNNPDV